MHAELLVGVQEAGGLTVAGADRPEGCGGVGEGAGDVAGFRCAGGDGDGLGRDFELRAVEFHGVGPWLHGWGCESAAAGGVGPVLRGGVEPVDDGLKVAGDTRGCAGDVAATGGWDVAFDIEVDKEEEVEVCQFGDTAAAEGQGVWSIETHTAVFGLDVAGVHVECERCVVAAIVAVDVSEEGTTG